MYWAALLRVLDLEVPHTLTPPSSPACSLFHTEDSEAQGGQATPSSLPSDGKMSPGPAPQRDRLCFCLMETL